MVYSGDGVLGRGQLARPHQQWGLGERCKLRQRGSWPSPDRSTFSFILRSPGVLFCHAKGLYTAADVPQSASKGVHANPLKGPEIT